MTIVHVISWLHIYEVLPRPGTIVRVVEFLNPNPTVTLTLILVSWDIYCKSSYIETHKREINQKNIGNRVQYWYEFEKT